MYIMDKSIFTVKIINKNPNMVITGLRVLLGSKGALTAPCTLYIHERYISLGPRVTRPRWFDLPLTRAESIAYNSELRLTCGPSEHPEDHIIVDSIKVYGKTKEAFGWPQDEPVAAKNTSSAPSTVGSKQTSKPVATNNGSDADSDISGASQTPAAANISNTGIADEFLQSCLTALNNAFYDKFQESKSDDLRGLAIGGTSDLLTEPLSSRVYHSLKYLMKKLFDTKAECYQFMDEVLLKHAAESLKNESSKTGKLIDEDSFQRCLYHLSMIARRRPFNVTAIKLGDEQDVQLIDLEASTPDEPANKDESSFHVTLLQRIMSAFWRLLGNKPRSKLLVPPCLPGLTRVEMTVKIIIDIIHAVAASVPSAMSTATSIYYQLLSHANSRVSYAAKTALIRLLRVKSDHSRDGVGSVMRSCSKSSDTPPSTRSASPSIDSSHVNTELGLAQSSTLSLGIGRGSRLVQTMRNRPSSHISSQGTAGGTIYDDDGEDDDDDDDDEDDDDDDDDEDDDDNDEDDDDNENYEDLGNDDVAMAIEDQLRHQGEPMEMERSVMQNDRQFFEDMMPGAVPDDAAEEYARMFGHNDGAPPDSGNRENGQGMADSRSLAIDVMRAMAAEAENGVNMGEPNDLENMLMRIDFPNLLPPDVDDDEAMVEYAIALSLQQQGAIGSMNNNPPDRHGASAGERRHSLSEDGSSSASDAGDHVPDSVQDAEAGSQDAAPQSEDQDHHQEECLEVDKEETSSCRGGESLIGAGRLTEIRISLLWDLFDRIDEVKKIGGEKSIPYFQVLATLISSLNLSDESHLQLHRKIVAKIVAELNGEMKSQESENSISVCTPSHEVFVVMMRLLSVMMSKSHTSLGKESDAVERGEFPASIHHQTMKILAELGIKEMCFSLLNTLYKEQWKKQADLKKSNQDTDATPTSSAALLKSLPHRHATDMSPFFLSQYVQSYAGMIFEPYLRLITEMALNLAYQVRKTCSAGGSEVSAVFGVEWRQLLSEFMLFAGMPSLVRRRARKLLLYITGSKEKYREERDLHALRFYMEQSSKLCQVNNVVEQPGRPEFNAGLSLTYNDLIELVETLKKSCDIAESRVKNWQKYCIADPSCLPFLLNTSVRAEENVASSTLKLLLCAIAVDNAPNEKGKKLTKSASKASVSSSKAGKEAKSASSSQRGDKHMSQQLSVQILANISDANLLDFFRHFLLEMNSTAIRWSAHALVLNLFRNTDSACQLRLVNTLWQLCSQTPSYGTKAAQFIDLLGYLSMKLGLEQDAAKAFTDATVQVLQRQNRILSNHQNAILYSQLANYVQFDGFYLESNPCLVCNQLETPLSNIKMSSIKSDTRYTTTQQIIKLVGSYAIQKVTIKVTDIKRTKMIRTAVMYYNNKRVPAIVDLKNNPSMWHRAKSITVPQGEPEIRFDLPLPIVATNLMLEFTDFYENVSASIETLQCPRCSASVQANPGICSNCGENVFQCHKCRSINYDEKDPYLCNVCGFSKYAKFDITVTARQCCAVDSIENDEDRKKMVANVVTLLEKADNVYNQLNAHKPQLEALLLQISQISSDTTPNPDPAPVVKKPKNQPVTLNNASSQGAVNTSVSSSIQQLAKKYCIVRKKNIVTPSGFQKS
uniref:E3 ubiquitin-protein ligase UBR4-like n=1 Tax=Phallusia mammillata TaxID=59560 RepID=A0A6F9DWC2_9ASCI|nr:E3 ubiquitin-protein ligase UBR4-like [Phallusia mammillata]